MIFIEWPMLTIIGLVDLALFIFWMVCKLRPRVLNNDRVRFIYELMNGTEVDVEEYEDA